MSFRGKPARNDLWGLVGEYRKFVEIADRLANKGDMRNARLVYGVASEKAKNVADNARDIETVVKYLEMAFNAAELSDEPKNAEGLHILLDLYSTMRDKSLASVYSEIAPILRKALMEKRDNPEVKTTDTDSLEKDPLRFLKRQDDREMFRLEVIEGLKKWESIYDGSTGMYISRARFPRAELMSPEDLHLSLYMIDRMLVNIAMDMRVSNLLSAAIISRQSDIIGPEDFDIDDALGFFRHNGAHIGINASGYAELYTERIRCSIEDFKKFATLLDVTASRVERVYANNEK